MTNIAKFTSRFILLLILCFLMVSLPNVETVGASSEIWSHTYGGPGDESTRAMVQTSDGGYALAGMTSSFGAGYADFWLVKLDMYGNVEWNQTYGGTRTDRAYSLVETSDGGFALAGSTDSFAEDHDFWLIKTDRYGNVEWNQTYGGGANDESAYSLVQTSDGGYALAGRTHFFDVGDVDVWLVKTDANGNMEWNQTYGEADYDSAYSLVETSDGGFALAGDTGSFGAGADDFWLVKTDANGNVEWNQTYGGADFEIAYSLVETSDGGFALAGDTGSFGAGRNDFWLVKTDANGNMEWNQTYGGAQPDRAYSLVETFDGGFALAGYTYSFGAGIEDFWLVKTNMYGNMEWNQTYGGAGFDRAYSFVETSEGVYTLAGDTDSFGPGYQERWEAPGPQDVWLIKTDGKSVVSIVSPDNKTYTVYNVSLTFTFSEPAAWMGYSLDGQDNVTINGNTTLAGLSNGSHNITVYARDSAGRIGASETVHFNIEVLTPEPQPSEPFPAWVVAALVIIAVVGAALLVYFRRIRKKLPST